eukprot:scaffold143712_cov25-Tisochrysis_lutea.AAC.3
MALLALQAQAEDALCQLFERARCRALSYVCENHLLAFACRAADAVRHREQAAAIVLQKHCRGFLVRRRLDRFRCGHAAYKSSSKWRAQCYAGDKQH